MPQRLSREGKTLSLFRLIRVWSRYSDALYSANCTIYRRFSCRKEPAEQAWFSSRFSFLSGSALKTDQLLIRLNCFSFPSVLW